MGWISRSGSLTQSEMENNADIVISYYRSIGINDNTIAALLGNMRAESSVNPKREEVGGSGYGLVQWTPVSVLQNHCNALGLSPYYDGDVQLKVIIAEIRGQSGTNEWYSTSAFISNYYNSGATSDMIGITGEQFLSNSMGWTPDKLAVLFMACYERPSYDPNINHYQLRQQYANNWLDYMGGSSSFVPRTDDTGINGDPHYYSRNPFYLAGYGMPNCTCYAWGRFWEIADPNNQYINRPTLSTGNGGQWWGYTSDGYERGSTPRLGAVICFDNSGEAGHVAIVEEIKPNGDVVTSNSAWQSTYFYMKTYKASDGYNFGSYQFQGFIYNPYAHQPQPQPTPTKKKTGFNFVLFDKKRKGMYFNG